MERQGKDGIRAAWTAMERIGRNGKQRDHTMAKTKELNRSDEVRKLSAEYEANGKVLKAEDMLKEAKNKTRWPALHKHLWDPSEADLANEARLHRCYLLIAHIHVRTSKGTTTRFIVHTRGVPGHRPVTAYVEDVDLAKMKLLQLASEIEAARLRLRGFQDILPKGAGAKIDQALELAERRVRREAEKRPKPTKKAA